MKILYLCHRIPYPPNKGDKIRSFNEIKYLSTAHKVHLACLADNPSDLRYENDLKEFCEQICVVPLKSIRAKLKSLVSLISKRPLSIGYFYSKPLQTTVNQWLFSNHYDGIICFSSPTAEYLFRSPALAYRFSKQPLGIQLQEGGTNAIDPMNPINSSNPRNPNNPKLITDFCDMDSDKWLQYSQWAGFPLTWIYRVESKLLFKYERRINQSFDHSVFVSEQEADLFLKLFPEARNVMAISNGVDYNYFSPNSSDIQHPASSIQHPVLLFTGAMDYHANVDGVTWFSNEIFPMIKMKFPESQFHIVGSNPAPKVRNLGNENSIKITGFVEDIRPYYQAADICVIPLRLARGIQNKVLEAMAMGKAVVTTTKAIQGIQAVPGEHVLVEDTPQDFSHVVLRLLKDHDARKRLGTKARQFVLENYNWATNMRKFETLLRT